MNGLNSLEIRAMYQFGEFSADALNRTVGRNHVPVPLNRRAFNVLLYLVMNPGRLVTKEELLRNVWSDAVVDENNLNQNISFEAVAALEPARPYALYSYAALPQRGAAYLKTKNRPTAAAEYKRILANPGVNPGHWSYPLALLGLARAYALSGDVTASRNENAALFAAFNDADPGLPVLRGARVERAALPSR
jgi:hypothetical protein